MKKKQLYHPPQLTVVTVRTEHVFQSPQHDLQMGFESRSQSGNWGDDNAENSQEIDGQLWYF